MVAKARIRALAAWTSTLVLALAALGAGAACSTALENGQPVFDLIIENGHVIDGTGSPWYAADVGIRSGKIAAIGHFASTATRRIDAHGMVIAAGFIDMLGQSELTILVNPREP